MRLVTRTLATFLFLQTTWSALAWACSCVQLAGDGVTLMEDYDEVFLGEAGRTRKELGNCGSSMREGTTRFEVIEGFKGVEDGDTLSVDHVIMGASCGVEFEPGEVYLVYAYDGRTNLCAPGGHEDNTLGWLEDLREAAL